MLSCLGWMCGGVRPLTRLKRSCMSRSVKLRRGVVVGAVVPVASVAVLAAAHRWCDCDCLMLGAQKASLALTSAESPSRSRLK